MTVMVTLAVLGVALSVPPATRGLGAGITIAAVCGVFVATRAKRTAMALARGQELAQAHMLELETAARLDREALDAFAEGLDIWVFLVDGQGDISYANEKACEVFGFPNPVGSSILGVTLSRDMASLVEHAAEADPTKFHEIVFGHPKERIGLVRVWPQNPNKDRFFVSVYDVTDLRRLERARRDFVANVSHELRTPMATIRAIAETLLDDTDSRNAGDQRYLEKIVSEIDRLTRISNDLLTLSAAESKTMVMERVNLSDLARSAIHQVLPKATKKGLELVGEIVPSTPVNAHNEQMVQVLLNLLDNAVNYTSKGRVVLRAFSRDGLARVEVEDTGIGIPSEHLDRIFERFYRVEKARSRESGGTGLGLSIVRHIVESHGGKVGVESELNKGTTFWFTLPLASE